MNRIFISYRTVDGAKDASRLAADLGRVFGDGHVFIDRQDLRGGKRWREEISRTLGVRPVVLVLVTPGFAGARHADGRLRMDDLDDPVRMEIESAIEAGATLLPLRVDGTPMPDAAMLPASLRRLTTYHALPLRTDDWSETDLPRIVDDLVTLGVPRVDIARSLFPMPWLGIARGFGVAGVSAIAAVLILAWLQRGSGADGEVVLPATASGPLREARLPSPDLSGPWLLDTATGQRIAVSIHQTESRLELRSDPVRIDHDPAWRTYLDTISAQDGERLTHVIYSARGELITDAASLALTVASADERFVVDTGALKLRIGPKGQVIAGQLVLNSGEQTTVVLSRRP
ncbi:toll/interleukin-1 receptor domain-containing protein [Methyloversatilis thermotolerans]|uniref:toll/interleukin-1 receptor domain-containing protein n=1 Tax=Methyloversatilis thermotolerans TaxID=1346290 RepID=UPI00036CA24B|nr:toll/interleukin-1 receptor domain-containing protein [Methyloversatilis thermotolerans]